MKTTFFHLAIIMLAVISLSSCKKDEQEAKNYYKYNDIEVPIATVFSQKISKTGTPGVYGTNIAFLSKGITLNFENGIPSFYSGVGDLLSITLYSNDSTTLIPGDYNFNIANYPLLPNTFGSSSAIAIGWDFSSGKIPAVVNLWGGKISVKKNGDEYEIDVNAETIINSTVVGHFKGKIARY